MAEARSSEEVLDFPCSPCQRKNLGIEAHVGCQTCQQYFCLTCSSSHSSLHPDHKVLKPSNSQQLRFDQLTERCPRHLDEVIKMYCPTHDEVTCSLCIALSHRSCAAPRYILTDLKQLMTQSDLQKLGSQEDSLHIARDVLQQHIKRLEVDKVSATTAIQQTYRRVVNTLDKLMNNAVKEVKSKSHEILLKINAQLSKTDKILEEFKEMRSTAVNEAQIFVTLKQNKPKIKEAEKLNDDILNSSGQHGLVFSIDSRLEKCLAEMKLLGNVNTKDLHLYQETKTYSKPILVDGDKNCSITSCCIMHDGSVVIVDNNNKKLKHLHRANLSVQSSYYLEEGPRSVCCTNPNEVVVCSERRSLHIFEVTVGFVQKGGINLKQDCRSIAYRKGEMYVSDGGKHIHVYDTNVSLLRSLGPTSAKTEFDGADQIMFNADGTKLLVVNRDMLVCVDRIGKELFCYRNSYRIQQLVAICSDGGQGFFFVGSANIVQLGAKGEKMGKVLKESNNRTTPQAVCFNPITKQLIVAYARNTLQVYELV